MFGSVEAMLSASADKPLWRAVLEDDCQDRDADPAASLARMGRLWQGMKEALEEYDPARRSASGLSGGQGARMADLADPICGSFVQEVASVALKLGEHNACMGRIVAAPTAGACGVLPAVLIPLQRREGLSDETMVECLYVSAGFGQVIAQRASISGAECGCQAEIGSASAMAAGGLAYLMGGGAEEITHASAIALKSLLGLVCDPVAGLVEVPCVKRNVIGAVNAVTSADMAMAGITSRIPPDEVIDAMRTVGMALPCSLRETGEGGLAATATGVEISKKLISSF